MHNRYDGYREEGKQHRHGNWVKKIPGHKEIANDSFQINMNKLEWLSEDVPLFFLLECKPLSEHQSYSKQKDLMTENINLKH